MGQDGCVRLLTAVVLLLLAALAAGCGGGDDGVAEDTDGGKRRITVWVLENEPERLRLTRANVAEFTELTGIAVELRGIGDEELASRVDRARRDGRLPDVAQLPLGSAHAYARQGLLDESAAEQVVEQLGDETFSQTALTLVSSDGRMTAVPSDGWGQLLIYRRDLFDAAGLEPPETLEDVRRAARRLNRGDSAGITLATDVSAFTAETFEHVALAAGCELVDDAGEVTLDSPACRKAFAIYTDLARNSVGGEQTADSTLRAYFAGRAAMIFWSPFLLDAMAGLRDDARPTCPACAQDPAFLARNSGLVGALGSSGAPPSQFGELANWGIFSGQDADAAQRFVEYMLSDGYLRWLGLSPQGKYPVRAGDDADPERYFNAWEGLLSGVDRTAPLRRFYSEASIASLRDGVRRIRRWGFSQDQAVLAGALRSTQPVARALHEAITGRLTPDQAARQAAREVEELAATLD
jgi:multiple sugar transport system substrate-binding protein